MEGTLISTASSLIAAEEARERFRPAPASSGLAAIDKHALDGGFRYGEITSIAGAPGVGKTLVSTLCCPYRRDKMCMFLCSSVGGELIRLIVGISCHCQPPATFWKERSRCH